MCAEEIETLLEHQPYVIFPGICKDAHHSKFVLKVHRWEDGRADNECRLMQKQNAVAG